MAQRTVLRAAALLGALSVVMAGCGSEGGGTSAPGAQESATADPSAQDCEPAQATASGLPSAEPLKIGSLLPETGSLAFLGPPEFAAVEVAIDEINAAGGVLDNDVIHVRGDSGDAKTDTANQTVDRELAAGVQVIVGAASSAVTELVIDKITGAGAVQISPANTSDEFTCWEDKGLDFRTAPPDVLQAQALSELIAADGAQRISILALNDPYGTGLADNTVQNLRDAGIAQDQIQKIIYDPNAPSYNAEIDAIKQFNPEAIAVIGFDESKKILIRMSEVQIGPADKLVYGTDGNMGNALGQGLAPGLLAGMKGTTPFAEQAGTFVPRLQDEDPDLVDFNYGGEAYDAVVIVALAASPAVVAIDAPHKIASCRVYWADPRDDPWKARNAIPVEMSAFGIVLERVVQLRTLVAAFRESHPNLPQHPEPAHPAPQVVPLPVLTERLQQCRAELRPGWRYCPGCGSPSERATREA